MKNKVIEINSLNCKYILLPQHRIKGNNKKSKWIVSQADEVDIFRKSHEKEWKVENHSWGLYINNKKICKVGILVNKKVSYIAKFVDGNSNQEWHGYPADVVGNRQDVPSTKILLKWCEEKIIKKHQMIKIKRGFGCDL